jgi:hypothetical protein
MAYSSPADLYAFGVPRGAIPNPGRLAGVVSAADNTIGLDVHGFALDDLVSFRAEAGGSLPSPLVAGVDYYAIPVRESYFSVATTAGGSAVDLTTVGARIVVIAPLNLDAAIAWADRQIDDMCPAHVVPIVAPIPDIIRMTSAELAAGKLGYFTGASSKSLTMIFDFAQKRLARWSKGVPIRGTNAPAPAGLAASAPIARYTDSRGWSRYGGIS